MGWTERFSIEHDWQLYREFLDTIEPQVDALLESWLDGLRQGAEQIDDSEQRADFLEFYGETYNDRLEFKGIFLNSFFSSSYALFEYHLYRICERARQRHSIPFSARDLKGSSLDAPKKYLQELDGNFPTNAEEWPRIKKYRQVRNKIMHEGGYIRGGDTSFDQFIEEHGLVSDRRIERPYLELTPDFCQMALDDFKQFLFKAHQVNMDNQKHEPTGPTVEVRTV